MRLRPMGRTDQGPGEAGVDDRSRFARTRVAADGHAAARVRAEFRQWLDRHFSLNDEQRGDLLLAVNEALANTAEFAYVGAAQGGTMDVSATYDEDSGTLAVTIEDRGRWRQQVPEPAAARRGPQVRGRGLDLMRILADEVTIDRTPQGTHVRLIWTDVDPRSDA